MTRNEKIRICMVSDFFFPNMGGVESHIYELSQCLLSRGHSVIVITHHYGDRTGIRYLTNGLKVYYLPLPAFYNQVILPTVFTTLPLIRFILLRERIDIVHGHSAFSTLAHETMLHARTLGLCTVFTDHSLFGFADASSILTNKVLRFSLAAASQVICVSHTSKENTVLRASLHPSKVSVISNAVDSKMFTPEPSRSCPNKVTIVVISRLVYRKGTDLLAALIPRLCSLHQDVHFLIGGDGPKRSLIEEIVERCKLHDRVTLLGSVRHTDVRDVLVQGDIFLNTSLTEAFCIAIVEAASCGLQVVSTNVGGVPEVLPPDLITLANPDVQSLEAALEALIARKREGKVIPAMEVHDRVSKLYTWYNVSERTEAIYAQIMQNYQQQSPREWLASYLDTGPVAGKLFILVASLNYLFLLFLNWWIPPETIDLVRTEPSVKLKDEKDRRNFPTKIKTS